MLCNQVEANIDRAFLSQRQKETSKRSMSMSPGEAASHISLQELSKTAIFDCQVTPLYLLGGKELLPMWHIILWIDAQSSCASGLPGLHGVVSDESNAVARITTETDRRCHQNSKRILQLSKVSQKKT